MKHLMVLVLLTAATALMSGCSKKQPAEPTTPAAPAAVEEAADNTAAEETPAAPAQPEVQAPAAAEAPAGDLKPIPLVLPRPMFVGTPENLDGIDNLEKPLGKARPPFMAPEGTVNLALNKSVTGSEAEPITGSLDMIVDGDKEAVEGSVVELGPFIQWVQIDLEAKSDVYAVVMWHYHKTPRVYFDVVVQVSDDPDFVTDVKTVFNNDMDNSLGFGAGQDRHYVETAEGKLVDAKGVQGRYVRCYSQANNQNDYSHYIEVEVYGKPSK
jgi:hypothetical protein